MAFVILVSGGLLLALPGLTASLARRMVPKRWARLCVAALSTGAVLVALSFALIAAPTVLSALGVHTLAAACHRLLGPLAPGGTLVGWTAALAAVALSGSGTHRVVVVLRRNRDVEVEPWLGEHEAWKGHDVVVLPTDEVLAYSIRGRRSQIVVSRGLVVALSPAELHAVLRHEAAHLEHRHQRFLLLATVLESGAPFLCPLHRSTRSLRTSLERWADEESVGADAEARQVLRSALLGVTAATLHPTLAAFSAGDTIMERIRALEAPPVQRTSLPQVVFSAPGAALGLAGITALDVWAGDAQFLIAMAGRCPI